MAGLGSKLEPTQHAEFNLYHGFHSPCQQIPDPVRFAKKCATMGDEKTADKLMKQAEKVLKPSLMSARFKPDWDEAYPLFEKAARQYQVLYAIAAA